jgi:hypothetical protein
MTKITRKGLDDLINGRAKFKAWWTTPDSHELNRQEKALYAAARRRRFLLRPAATRRRFNLTNVWMLHCELEGVPYLVVTTGRKNAEVWVDLIAYPYVLNDEGRRAADRLLSGAGVRGTWISIGECCVRATVPLADAEFVAGQLYDLLVEFAVQRERH